jgi:hypothetical protein
MRLTTAALSGKLYISAITLVEVNYLSSKKSFPYSGVSPRLIALATDPKVWEFLTTNNTNLTNEEEWCRRV